MFIKFDKLNSLGVNAVNIDFIFDEEGDMISNADVFSKLTKTINYCQSKYFGLTKKFFAWYFLFKVYLKD